MRRCNWGLRQPGVVVAADRPCSRRRCIAVEGVLVTKDADRIDISVTYTIRNTRMRSVFTANIRAEY